MLRKIVLPAILGAAFVGVLAATSASAQYYVGRGAASYVGDVYPGDYYAPGYGDPQSAWIARQHWEDHERWEQRERWEREEERRHHWQQERWEHRGWHGDDDYGDW
jgi:hypothetical protein